ncbi:MAG: hypothetical protein ACRETC_06345 [Gammaproteobacteria bacterium]
MLSPVLIWPHFDPQTVAGERRVQRRLKHVSPTVIEAQSALALVSGVFGIDTPPAAALTRLAEGRPVGSAWFMAEPVILTPDRDRLLLRRLGEDGLSTSESRALIDTSHEHFPETELRLEWAGPGHWYARLDGAEPRSGLPAEMAEGTAIEATPGIFGVNADGMRVLNELQMLWYEHPVNRARQAAGRLQANALWVWGGGALPPAPPRVAARMLAARSAELDGLAQWLDLERREPDAALDKGIEPGLVAVIGAGEDTLGRRWLTAFARQRGAFRLFGAGRMWDVPRRRFWQRW